HGRGRPGDDVGSSLTGHTYERRGGRFHRLLQALAEVQARAQRLSRPGCQQHRRHHEDAQRDDNSVPHSPSPPLVTILPGLEAAAISDSAAATTAPTAATA